MKKRRRSGGFTLIELLLVVVIIGILAAIVVPKLAGRSRDAQDAAAKADMKNIGTALDMFEVDLGRYPTTDEGLSSLMAAPPSLPDTTKWKGPYLKAKQVPMDPWGREYVFLSPGQQNPSGYDLFSSGADGQQGTADDIQD